MDPLVLTVLVAAFSLATLIFVMVLVAARADHQVTVRGPMATLEELKRQIDSKRESLVDLDDDLKQRREALADIAGIQADVDALVRQKRELDTEHSQLEDRRKEVLAVRDDTEKALLQQAEAARFLAETKDELKQVQADLAEARRLVGEIEILSDRHKSLTDKISQLQPKADNLKAIIGQEDALRSRLPELEQEVARLDSAIELRRGQRENAEAESQAAEKRLGELRPELVEAVADLAVVRKEVLHSEDKVAELRNIRVELEQSVAGLRDRLGEQQGQSLVSDPLAELRVLPPVLEGLRKRDKNHYGSEADALNRTQEHLNALGLSYSKRTVHAFHTAMKVNETTQMAVLSGISGTGKSQLPRRYAEAMGIAFLQVSVQPRWDSPQDLMGFYNYIESRFRPTDMARALFHMDAWNGPADSSDLQDRMLLILLDEMNLARVEYYFSDFLSRLESRPGRIQTAEDSLRKDAEIELDIPMPKGQPTPRIFPGYNVLFAGTMNEDESTQSLSDKVMDRANVLRFAAPNNIADPIFDNDRQAPLALSRGLWMNWVCDVSKLSNDDQHDVKEHIAKVVNLMKKFERPVGHRLGQSIMAYVANYPRFQVYQDNRFPLADQVEMRILPKLRGVELDTSQGGLDDLRRYVENELDDGQLAEAISTSIEASRKTGQFIWRGVTRE